ncbi:coagulation factor IXa [Hypomesus transpacificus]|uniref:coagulation factor IXa n=1 Tax=Hypomesus transpacificus TaxID=137520 RepID=UPI001F079889|nr:coagulation factor IXa [Hypomesus transpacificus]
MVAVHLSLLWCLLVLDCLLGYGAPDPGPGPGPDPGEVFLSGQAADTVLRRQRRSNTGLFEELLKGNLERECLEERCDLEEAREVFENDEKTMAFWAGYADGDQCRSQPCQHQGSCRDMLASYACLCQPGFTGKNCEIVTDRQCEMNNGGCRHFCRSVGTAGAQCHCADGYKLAEDRQTCLPEVEFPCGRDARMVSTRSLLTKGSSGLVNITTVAQIPPAPSPTSDSTTARPPTTTTARPPTTTTTTISRSRSRLPNWVYGPAEPPPTEPHLTKPRPTMTAYTKPRPTDILPTETLFDKTRIVGGYAASPGDIPWQVALVVRSSGQLFCGGSILSELWVITAAHCLVEAQHGSYFVRVGEHNVNRKEGSEQDREVAQHVPHPLYDSTQSLYNHDIALLRLRTPITFSANVRPVCLGPKDFTENLIKEASPATVSGWGRTRFQGATASMLQWVEVPFTERTECKESSSARITRYMFCAGYRDVAKDACQGDSGGPHTNRFHDTQFLTGIVSWGEECAKEGKYGVYTRVAHYYRWIRHVMQVTRGSLLTSVDQ